MLLYLLVGTGIPPAAHGGCVRVEPTRLVIRRGPEPATDRVVWRVKDASVDLGIADPTATEVRVEFVDADGRRFFSATVPPSSAPYWTAIGNGRGWRYQGHDDPANADGIRRIRSTSDRFVFRGAGVDLHEVEAPVALPLAARLTAGGRCFEAVFSGCRRNDSKRVICPKDCAASELRAAANADRTVILDLQASSPWPDRLRAFNVYANALPPSAGGLERGYELTARVFGQREGRRVRIWLRPSRWPDLGFDARSCEWLQPNSETRRIDTLVERYASEGALVEMVLLGQPAEFSSACTASECAGRMRPGGRCTCWCEDLAGPCNDPARSDFWKYAPRPEAYEDPAWQAHWGCMLEHFAALGARRFEIWNEPDGTPFFGGEFPNGAAPLREQQFERMFREMFTVLDNARAGLAPEVAAQVEIGGPAMSRIDGTIGSPPDGGPSLPRILADLATAGGKLDFVSAHLYTADPATPFLDGRFDRFRAAIPVAWCPPGSACDVELEVNEWNVALGTRHPCDDTDRALPGWQVPVAGRSGESAESCDHRGAGWAAYMLAGLAGLPPDIWPYVFEPLAEPSAERCDLVETSYGLFSLHGIPKPLARVHWAVAQIDWRFLGAGQETLSERSFGWLAGSDRDGAVHVVLGQVDSSPAMHFQRAYTAAGHDVGELLASCGCSPPPDEHTTPEECLARAIAKAANSVDPPPAEALQAWCDCSCGPDCGCTGPITLQEAADALLAGHAAVARQQVEGTEMTVALGVRGLPCRKRFRVEVYPIDVENSTTAAWRRDGPFATVTTCNQDTITSMDSYAHWDWQQDRIWEKWVSLPGNRSLDAGSVIPAITVPAYGAVYVKIRPAPQGE